MWADTLLIAEKAHLVRVVVWAMASIVCGSAVLAVLAVRRVRSALLSAFALTTIAFGLFEGTVALVSLGGLAPRDLGAAAQLDRHLWFETGLDVGCVAVGVTLALAYWGVAHGKRLGGVGAGIGIIVQGAAMLALDARFVMMINSYI